MSAQKKENVILDVKNLKKYFPIQKGLLRKTVGYIKAVNGVDFYIKEGETLGMVGESGCGKTTTGRCIIRLLDPTEGTISFRMKDNMIDITKLSYGKMKKVYREMQIVFQDPYSSLDPRMTVRDIVAEPLRVQGVGAKKQRTQKVEELLEKVGLNPHQMNRYPHEFSGGQRQRIGIARTLALEPRFVICDEPVSALDVSVQAQILNMLSDLRDEMGLTFLFIAHDLSVVEHISNRIAVMYLGKIVEIAPASAIYTMPRHPYTEALLSAIPLGDPLVKKRRKGLEGSVPDPANPPPGCNFEPRCAYASKECCQKEPTLVKLKEDGEHFVACHLHDELQLKGYSGVG